MDILGVGFPELIFILIIAMMVFGPRRLPEIAAKAGKIVRDLRGMSQGLLLEWQREITVASRLEELQEMRQELEETRKELNQTQQEIGQQANEDIEQVKKIGASVADQKPVSPQSQPSKIPSASSETEGDAKSDSDQASEEDASASPAPDSDSAAQQDVEEASSEEKTIISQPDTLTENESTAGVSSEAEVAKFNGRPVSTDTPEESSAGNPSASSSSKSKEALNE